MPTQSDEIFHFNGKKLTPMPLHSLRDGLWGKTLEDALQTFFEKYPQILPGKQIDPVSEDPPHFVLLRREMPVGGWSLDHLFIDQNSILTLVETKLFQNPESRREVIGQIIEYAASAPESWSGGRARQKATEFWSNQNPPEELDGILQREFGEDLDIEEFWKKAEENLRDRKIRLIIATDELRSEVRRMIEYLNNEMQNTEVLGLELKFYGEQTESMVLVPLLAGQSQSIIDKKGSTSSSRMAWTKDTFLKDAKEKINDDAIYEILADLFDFSEKNALLELGTGSGTGSFTFKVKDSRAKSGLVSIFTVWSKGKIEFRYENIKRRLGEKYSDLLYSSLSKIMNIKYDTKSVQLKDALPNMDILRSFKSTVLEFIENVKQQGD